MKFERSLSRRWFLGAVSATAITVLSSPAQAGWIDDLLDNIRNDKKSNSKSGQLAQGEIGDGLREALRVATQRVIKRVGQADGFFLDQAIKIPLPNFLRSAQRVLENVGLSDELDDLQLRLNRGAEKSAQFAGDIFVKVIKEMTFEDAHNILEGPDDSATRYFEQKMSPELRSTFSPVFEDTLEDAGALTVFEKIARRNNELPFVSSLDVTARDELVDHGLTYALRGIFYYLGKEEAAIRHDPVKRTTELLRRVFG